MLFAGANVYWAVQPTRCGLRGRSVTRFSIGNSSFAGVYGLIRLAVKTFYYAIFHFASIALFELLFARCCGVPLSGSIHCQANTKLASLSLIIAKSEHSGVNNLKGLWRIL